MQVSATHNLYNTFQGELSFDRLLRVDGSFKGQLVSTGDLVIGATGVVRGNIEHLREVRYSLPVDLRDTSC